MNGNPVNDNAESNAGDDTKQALQAQLLKRYPIRRGCLQVDDWTLDYWTVDSAESQLDALIDEARPPGCDNDGSLRWEPYWAISWDSAIDCVRFALADTRSDARVLDLGCGYGAVGAAAADRGAKVVMVDNAEPAVCFAARNTWPWRDQVEIRVMDWSQDRLEGRFERIYGADILYDREQWAPLLRLWSRRLAAGGQLILGEPARRHSQDFPAWLANQGWEVHTQPAEHGRLIRARGGPR